MVFQGSEQASEMLKKSLEGVKGADDVSVDAKTRRATLSFTGLTATLSNLEKAGAPFAARIVSPAIVEFGVRRIKARGSAADLSGIIKGRVTDVLQASTSKLVVTADLEGADWAALFTESAEKGFELTPKSHAFATVTWSKDAKSDKEGSMVDALRGTRGVIVVKPTDGADEARVVTSADVGAAALKKAAKESGVKEKITLHW
jgi:hypothetical protein